MTTTIINPDILSQNLFKNPNFAVIQGTASGTLANSTALPTATLGYLGETEWCVAASGGTPAYAFSAANESVTFTGAASTTAIYLLQRIESKDMTTLANKLATVTISFETSNSLLTSVNWSLLRPTTTADTHGTIGTPTQTTIASGTITVNNTLTRYSVTVTLPATAALGAEFRLSVGAQTSGTWVVSRLQLEEGATATVFNCGNYLSELLKCRRNFYSLNTTQNYIWYGEAANRGHSPIVTFPVEMFSAPATSSGWSNGTNANILTPVTTTQNAAYTQIGTVAAGGASADLNWTTFLAHIP